MSPTLKTDPTSQSTLDSIVTQISGLLGPLSPFTKAVVGPACGLVTALVNWAVTGTFDAVSIEAAAGGVVIGLLTFELPNLEKPKPAVATVPVPVTPVVKKR